MWRALLLLACLGWPLVAWSGKGSITGTVLDQQDFPINLAIVKLSPGNLQLVTDREGRFVIDYLRDESGKRTKLAKKTTYTIEIFKPGYQIISKALYYKKGQLDLGVFALSSEKLEVLHDQTVIDPDAFTPTTQSSGATYEGQ